MKNWIFETFNGRMQDELLNETLFYDLDHARTSSLAGSLPTTSAGHISRWAISYPSPSQQLTSRNGRSAGQFKLS